MTSYSKHNFLIKIFPLIQSLRFLLQFSGPGGEKWGAGSAAWPRQQEARHDRPRGGHQHLRGTEMLLIRIKLEWYLPILVQ